MTDTSLDRWADDGGRQPSPEDLLSRRQLELRAEFNRDILDVRSRLQDLQKGLTPSSVVENFKTLLTNRISEKLHESWKNTVRKPDHLQHWRDAKFTDLDEVSQLTKKFPDRFRFNSTNGKWEIDLLSFTIGELPKRWSQENVDMANDAVEILLDDARSKKSQTFDDLRAQVHAQWMLRNAENLLKLVDSLLPERTDEAKAIREKVKLFRAPDGVFSAEVRQGALSELISLSRDLEKSENTKVEAKGKNAYTFNQFKATEDLSEDQQYRDEEPLMIAFREVKEELKARRHKDIVTSEPVRS